MLKHIVQLLAFKRNSNVNSIKSFLEYVRIQQVIDEIPLQQMLSLQKCKQDLLFFPSNNIQQNLNSLFFIKEFCLWVVHYIIQSLYKSPQFVSSSLVMHFPMKIIKKNRPLTLFTLPSFGGVVSLKQFQ